MKILPQHLLFTIICALTLQTTHAQFLPEKHYPKNYFQWPVGATKAIVANFGELRPNHYHMGLDCRTEQVVNKPVLAAADGYIARVRVEPWGFGQVIYLNHPNGMTTLYAHLNEFYPELEAYVQQQQYLKQSWAITLDMPPTMFPVKKGQQIAKSGSTGGSQGPHVHFEVRDTKTDKVLNPLLMGLPIADNIPPGIIRLAVYDRCLSTYEQRPKIYSLRKVGGVYVPTGGKIKIGSEKASFAITAFDQYSGSTNQNGIYEAILYDNEKPVSGFQLDSISYDETRYLNAHIDYNYRAAGGPYLQHLSRLPGYNNSIYKTDGSDGVVDLEDGNEHAIRIVVKDPNGNTSTIKFDIESTGKSAARPAKKDEFNKEFHPGYMNVFENEQVKFYLDETALYDSFTFRYSVVKDAKGDPVYKIHDATVPVHHYFAMNIRGSADPADTGKMVMHRSWGSKDDYAKAVYQGDGWYKASFREMGNYQLEIDNTPPTIVPSGFYSGMNASRLRRILFTVKDNSEEIVRFTAMLDGQWLRFTNDKGTNHIYEFDDKCGPGSHELVVTAEDLVGNITTKTYQFTR